MNNNELNKTADLILMEIFFSENKEKTREELMEIIKPIVLATYVDGLRRGRRQITNHIKEIFNNIDLESIN